MSSDDKRKVLGKGLSALLHGRTPSSPTSSALRPPFPEGPPATAATGTATAPVIAQAAPEPERSPTKLPIEVIHPNPLQPRTVFRADQLEELAASIRANGIIQPLIVRRQGHEFQIIAGERRWRAAKLAELREVPVVVQDLTDDTLLEIALIENIQREDLNPIETAQAFERLSREHGLSQEEIGRRTGKDRASIANLIRLLRLPKDVQLLVAEQRISMGHARAILGIPDPQEQIDLAERVASKGLSVRQVEAIVQQLTAEREGDGKAKKQEKQQDPNVKAAVESLERVLGTRVRIVESNEQRGRIEVDYFSQAELDRIYQLIAGEA
ncbi:MAG: ParB/RepB/Spo0J family partition protein [Acidobacteriota bacterium]